MRFPIRPFEKLPQFNFMGWRRFWVLFSIVSSLLAVGLMATRGLNFGIDFAGGKLIQVQIAQAPSIAEVRTALEAGNFPAATIQNYGAPTEFLIRLGANDPQVQQPLAEQRVEAALEAKLGSIEVRRVEFVGPQVGEELRLQGFLAMLMATLGILAYVWFRFELRYGLGGILALVHDVVLTVGILSILQTEITLTVLAAILTLIGYSLNDTIVIFDRIRENRQRYPNKPLVEVLNLSVNQTLARTIMTVSTTLLVLLALVTVGGDVIHDFALVLIIGVLLGTYSSIFVASPVLLLLEEYYQKMARERAAREAENPAP
ncbi:MAG: protein translocase subunit SecF [Pseudomonadota bacterium]|jgi:preprotein translocase subunit SecF